MHSIMVIQMKAIGLFCHFGLFSFLNFGFLGRNMCGSNNNTVVLLTLLRLAPNKLKRGGQDILLKTYVALMYCRTLKTAGKIESKTK